MRKFIIYVISVICVLAAALNASGASSFSNETLRYVISYKWGLIHKDAGDATLSLRNKNGIYSVMLSAKSRPWADKFYSVRDTLLGQIRVSDFRPVSYTKITHEKGKYGRDEIKYELSGHATKGHVRKYRLKNNVTSEKSATLSATGPVYDMLSIFYYLRRLDYSQLNRNKIFSSTLFSGDKKETVKIRSLGIEKIRLRDKSVREAYHIKFRFTSEGGKKSSDDIDTWISTDSRHIPLYLVGHLPVGEVRAYLVGE